MVKEGDKAIGFELDGSDGKKHTLGEFSGKYLVLYFYPKDNTPGCTIEANEFNKKVADIRKLGAEVVGISKDDLKSHAKFKDKYDLNFLLLSDPESRIIKAYGAYGNRGIFGYGTLRNTYIIGPSGKIVKIFEKVSPKGHADEVIQFIESSESAAN
ncbi:MAG: peroxiredoxin [Candidatus Marsarchaeota archaeon]|jgi:peroxiredoxin Q/BCP|nr:peroxiredoxin [Candidatus Marsarchaeota archaeon]MCL5419168.1 peroxiredoxin [Candidatus Marsarchaeota archaeon]